MGAGTSASDTPEPKGVRRVLAARAGRRSAARTAAADSPADTTGPSSAAGDAEAVTPRPVAGVAAVARPAPEAPVSAGPQVGTAPPAVQPEGPAPDSPAPSEPAVTAALPAAGDTGAADAVAAPGRPEEARSGGTDVKTGGGEPGAGETAAGAAPGVRSDPEPDSDPEPHAEPDPEPDAVAGTAAAEPDPAAGSASPGEAGDSTRRFPPVTLDTARPEGGGRAAPSDAPAPARQWPLLSVLGTTALGLLVVGTHPFQEAFRIGTILVGIALIGGALLRRTMPSVGMLAVRSRFTDMVTYGLLGIAIVLLALMTQPDPWLEIPFLEDLVHSTVP